MAKAVKVIGDAAVRRAGIRFASGCGVGGGVCSGGNFANDGTVNGTVEGPGQVIE